jgi:hypothetical protein
MAEAEVAWDLAQQLVGDEEETASTGRDVSKMSAEVQGGPPLATEENASPHVSPVTSM